MARRMVPVGSCSVRLLSSVFFILVCLAASCAPVHIKTVNRDTPIRSFEKTSGPSEPSRFILTCQALPDRAHDCLLEVESTCQTTTFQVVERTVETQRSTSTVAKVFEYGLAGALLVAGAGVMGDAHNVPDSSDPAQSNPVGRTGAYAIGASLAVVGTGLLALGITDSVRARDSEVSVGLVEITGPVKKFPCDRHPATETVVRGQVGVTTLDLGRTSQDGRLTIDIRASVPPSLLLGGGGVRSLVLLLDQKPLHKISLEGYRKEVCTVRLREANSALSPASKLKFFDDCPDAVELLGGSAEVKELALAAARGLVARCAAPPSQDALDACIDAADALNAAAPTDACQALTARLEQAKTRMEERAQAAEERAETQKRVAAEGRFRRARALTLSRQKAWPRGYDMLCFDEDDIPVPVTSDDLDFVDTGNCIDADDYWVRMWTMAHPSGVTSLVKILRARQLQARYPWSCSLSVESNIIPTSGNCSSLGVDWEGICCELESGFATRGVCALQRTSGRELQFDCALKEPIDGPLGAGTMTCGGNRITVWNGGWRQTSCKPFR